MRRARVLRITPVIVAVLGSVLLSTWVSGAKTPTKKHPPSSADFKVSQLASPNPAPVSGPATFKVTVTNGGPATKRATLIDSVTRPDPNGGGYDHGPTPSQGSCTPMDSSATFSCKLGTVKPGQTATVSFTRYYCPPAGRVLTNHATVLTALDPHPGNNTARLDDHTSDHQTGCG